MLFLYGVVGGGNEMISIGSSVPSVLRHGDVKSYLILSLISYLSRFTRFTHLPPKLPSNLESFKRSYSFFPEFSKTQLYCVSRVQHRGMDDPRSQTTLRPLR